MNFGSPLTNVTMTSTTIVTFDHTLRQSHWTTTSTILHIQDWISNIEATFTNRLVIFCPTLNIEKRIKYSIPINRLVNSIRHDLKPQVAGSSQIYLGAAKAEWSQSGDGNRCEAIRRNTMTCAINICVLFDDTNLQDKKEFEFGTSTCNAPYRQLQESGEGAFATSLYSTLRCSFSPVLLLEYRCRESPHSSLSHWIKMSTQNAVMEVWNPYFRYGCLLLFLTNRKLKGSESFAITNVYPALTGF